MNNLILQRGKNIVFILLLLFYVPSFCQHQNTDSLLLLINSQTATSETYNDLAEAFLLTTPIQAKTYALKALSLSRVDEISDENTRSLRILFEYYIEIRDIEKVNDIQLKIADISIQNNSQYTQGTSAYCQALLKFNISDLVNSSKYFFTALQFFDKTKNTIEICKTYKYIGRIFYNQESYEKALEYYFLSLNFAKANNYQDGVAAGLNNVAAVMDTKKQYHKAIQYFEQALLINSQTNNQYWQSINHLNIGIEEQKLKNYTEAKLNFQKALTLATEVESKRIISNTNNSIAELFIELHQIDSAYYYSKKALDIAYKAKIVKGIVTSTSTLHNIALLKKDTISAYQFEIQNRTFVDSFFRAEILQKTHLIEYEYELSKKREQMKNYKLKNKLTFIVIGFLILLLATIGIFIYYRLKDRIKKSDDRKQLIEQELKQKNKELTTKTLFIIQKNETMSQISNQLSELESNLKLDSNKKSIQQIAARLKRNTDEEVWREFEIYFQSVHPSFYENLLKKIPGLTSSEKKLAAFLRMNMSSKEISAITNQRISTLEVARSRLRKRLNITNKSISLHSFLSQF